MNRALAVFLLLGLFIAGASLVLWLSRLHREGNVMSPKGGIGLAALSFIFVGTSMIAETLPHSGKAVGASGKELPPDAFVIASTAGFFCTALLVTIGLLLKAAFQLASSWRSPSGSAHRRHAARLAIYSVGAFLVAYAHFTLMRVGPGLLK
jgi:hypothetical protein